MAESLINQLSIAGLAHRCRKEQERFLRKLAHDSRYCLELFRKAVQDQKSLIWDHVVAIFSPLVTGWVQSHSDFAASQEDRDVFVQGAFIRLWSAANRGSIEDFNHLGTILQYLKRCVHSEIIDHLRKERFPVVDIPDALLGETQSLGDPIASENLWRYVNEKMKSEEERVVMYATFFLNYRPRDIFAMYPDQFSSIKAIHRIKENMINRMRRDPEFATFFEVSV
jgi:DNA-directed RNA polymerase specialized sigma24 family protein